MTWAWFKGAVSVILTYVNYIQWKNHQESRRKMWEYKEYIDIDKLSDWALESSGCSWFLRFDHTLVGNIPNYRWSLPQGTNCAIKQYNSCKSTSKCCLDTSQSQWKSFRNTRCVGHCCTNNLFLFSRKTEQDCRVKFVVNYSLSFSF